MQDYLISMALAILFSVLKQSVKNAQSKANMKAAFLKLFNAIKALYADDPDFQ
jgi:ABC-type uncharacterized transport system permease subunit